MIHGKGRGYILWDKGWKGEGASREGSDGGRGAVSGRERKESGGIFGHEGGKVTSEDEKREEAQRRRRRKRKAICRMKEDKDFPKKDGV